MKKEVEHQVKNSQPCQTVRNAPPTAPLHPWLWPTRPWQRILVDFSGSFHGKMFLLAIYAHSKWPEVVNMSITSARCIVEELHKMFASYGTSKQLVSDNGFELMKMNGVKQIKCTPYHPSSNVMKCGCRKVGSDIQRFREN